MNANDSLDSLNLMIKLAQPFKSFILHKELFRFIPDKSRVCICFLSTDFHSDEFFLSSLYRKMKKKFAVISSLSPSKMFCCLIARLKKKKTKRVGYIVGYQMEKKERQLRLKKRYERVGLN